MRWKVSASREQVTHIWEGGSTPDQVAQKLTYWRALAKARTARFAALRLGPESMFRPDPKEVGEQEGWYASALADLDWARIACGEDGGWNSQGFDHLTGTGWYRLRFHLPADFGQGRHVRLFVGAADEDCTIYLNGQKAFEHTCDSTGLACEEEPEASVVLDMIRLQGK